MKSIKNIFLSIAILFGILFTQTTSVLAQGENSASAVGGTTWYVATTGNDGNDCLGTSTPCATINGAINKSVDDDTIQVAGGTYTGSGTQVVLINKSITLNGGWDAGFTAQNDSSIIDGEGTRRGITVDSGTVVIDHFTVQNGFHTNQGGGIQNNGTLTLTNSVISNNISGLFGGGIYTYGTLTINNTAIVGNTTGDPLLSGGAGGGGIYNGGSAGVVVMNNTSVINNKYLGFFYGAGILNLGTFTVNNSTIANNQQTGFANLAGTFTLQNTIVAGNNNGAGDCSTGGTIVSLGYNLIGSTMGCSFNSTTGDLTYVNPLFGTLTGSPAYLPLLAGSPAINAGNPATPGSGGSACLSTDQRGEIRPQGSSCDIGAYEYKTVTISGNAGTASVVINYMEDSISKSATADESGNYSFYVTSGWSGTLTPSKPGWGFTPDHMDYTNLSSDQSGQDYTAARNAYLITGNTIVEGVTLSYEDNGPKSVVSDIFGNYTLPVSMGWSGTVTPSLAGKSFLPVNKSYTNVLADIALQNYSPTVSTILMPIGSITDQTPTYSWYKLGATQYQYQLYKGSTLIYTKTVPASVCGPALCVNTPTTKLADGSYKWRVRGMINKVWRAYTPYKAFTLGPKAGYWSGSANDFYVVPKQNKLIYFATYISVQGCGNYQIWNPAALNIVNKKFAFSGAFYANGTFTKTNMRASGRLGLDHFFLSGCGYVSGGPFNWVSNWIDGSQPTLGLRELQGTSLLDLPGALDQHPTPFIFTVDPE